MSSISSSDKNIHSPRMNNTEEYLNDLYKYFQQQEQQGENNDDIYSGCDYQNQHFDQASLVEEFSYQDGQFECRNLIQSYEQNSFIKENEKGTSSQPISTLRNKKTQSVQNILKNQSNSYQSQHLSKNQQTTNNRSLSALVSASKKRPYKPKKTLSQRSTSTTKSFTTKNKILQAQKEKKKNGDDSIEPLFLNPLTSLPTETINIQAFEKFYKIDYDNLFQKIEQTYKKLSLLGEKTFFKDKNNQSLINDIFQLVGIKNSTKLGKGRALRELKAVYQYMKISNPQDQQQKLNKIGQTAHKLQPSYLSFFKQMLGYPQPEQQKFSSGKKGLERYGFQKLERKR